MNKGNISEAFNRIREMHKKPLKESHRRRLHEEHNFITDSLQYNSKLVGQIRDAYKNLKKDDDTSVTYMVYLPSMDYKNNWAICLAYMDYDDNGDWRIYGKLAYQPKNSGMSEYDIDWMMPYDEKTGDVWDTEEVIDDQDDLESAISWWSGLWENIKDTIISDSDDEDEDDDFYDMSESLRKRHDVKKN